MARVSGVKEKVHSPMYDAFFVPALNQQGNPNTFTEEMNRRDPRVIRFFVDVQNKTRLETNLQAAGVLPSQNMFEARALRVVVSQIDPRIDAASGVATNTTDVDFLTQLIYSSVTTLLVGEKVMIEMPTYWFPAGAGVATVPNHGQPDALATFRFAEPVMIEPQQNFRVEMLFPQGVPGQGTPPAPFTLAGTVGALRVWVVLDGYLTRDVQ
jgi:hypothetical protein